MRKNPPFILFIICVAFAGTACNSTYQAQSLQYKSYRINPDQQSDSGAKALIGSYGKQVNETMNGVIGIVDKSLDKTQPESTLGNFMTDAFLEMAKQKYNTQVDLAFMNYGGMRLTQLAAGNVTTGKIFELMPFDNLLILQKVKGDVLQQVFDIMAERGGWPLAGATMQIKNKKAINITIGGKPLDVAATYTIANSDFIANGGDNANMLRPIPQISNGYLMRDALLDYIKWLKSSGKNVSAQIENRVTNAE